MCKYGVLCNTGQFFSFYALNNKELTGPAMTVFPVLVQNKVCGLRTVFTPLLHYAVSARVKRMTEVSR